MQVFTPEYDDKTVFPDRKLLCQLYLLTSHQLTQSSTHFQWKSSRPPVGDDAFSIDRAEVTAGGHVPFL
jgi:hypothetical protein